MRTFLSPAELQLKLRLPEREWDVIQFLMDELDARLVEDDGPEWMRKTKPKETTYAD